MKIAGTGLNGLIGSRIVELLPQHDFENFSRTSGVDILNYESIFSALEKSDAETVIHLAAYTDVKGAEAEKNLGEESESWKVNVLGTKNVVKAAEETDKKLIHFSTDMVVGGDKMPDGGYKENADYNPLSWYSTTKAEAEKIVLECKTEWVILRIAYPYRANFEKLDFVRFFKTKLENQESLTVLSDRIISPTFIDDIAQAVNAFAMTNNVGIFNVVGSSILSIYEAANQIAEVFNLDKSLIGKITRKEFLKERPPEPFSSALNNDKIKKLGITMHAFRDGLEIIKKQI